jgi:polyisoprenoid-binding protein YceI
MQRLLMLTLATLLATALVALPQSAAADTFKIDAAHTHVGFKVRHLGVSWVKGEFSDVKGTVQWDPASPGEMSMTIEIGVRSLDTRNKTRDTHLKSPDFFNAAKFPKMVFQSTSSKAVDGGLEVTGDMTIRDVTREVILTVEGPTEEVKDPYLGPKRGASATTRLSRKDYGLKWSKITEAGSIVVGNEIRIEIETELLVKKGK